VKNLAIWGNHSSTQFPDFSNATVDGQPVVGAVSDLAWLQGDFIATVQKRGAAIIEARGASSAASAANAAIDTVVGLTTPTPADDCISVAVTSDGAYGVPEGLTFGFRSRPTATDRGRSRKASTSTTSPPGRSRSPRTNCSPSAWTCAAWA